MKNKKIPGRDSSNGSDPEPEHSIRRSYRLRRVSKVISYIVLLAMAGGVTVIGVKVKELHFNPVVNVPHKKVVPKTKLQPGMAVHPEVILTGSINNIGEQEDAYLALHTFYDKWFLFKAATGNGQFECPIRIGTEADGGKVFKLRGLILPEGTDVKLETPLDNLPEGRKFWDTSTHRRL